MTIPQICAHKAVLLAAMTAATFALSGCSRHGDDDQQPDTAPTTSQSGTVAPVPTPEPNATPTPPLAPTAGTIPHVLRGTWGLVAADCTSTHGDAKGLMEVGARTLTFYESRATLKAIRTAEPARIRAQFALSGEGQDWTQDIELRSWNNGAQLIRQDRGPDALPGALTYTRCAG